MGHKFVDEVAKEEFFKKKILARFDFNVPLENTKILDTTRIDQSLPTIRFLLEQSPSTLILCSHLGRPKGTFVKKYSLAPVGEYLAQVLQQEILLAESVESDKAISLLIKSKKHKIILLENLRFFPEEEQGDPNFSKKLRDLADVFVMDAFGAAHRKHASTYTVIPLFKGKAFGGLLLKKELHSLSYLLNKPSAPFVAAMGGAKVKDKIKAIENLLPKVETLLLGGAMAYAFLKAKGVGIGDSLCSPEDVVLAKSLLTEKLASKIVLPIDHVIARNTEEKDSTQTRETLNSTIPEGFRGLDIGPRTRSLYRSAIIQGKTFFWNGPMGFFENPLFSVGTKSLALAVSEAKKANKDFFSVVGGGDSLAAVKETGLESYFSHLSTGGGASLEFLESGNLVGLTALKGYL